ncbi:MAG: ATP-binding cassette domain-containing protein [Proteobacteria bacterium]|nr:ATP-binding cassette domain-containing protein [Pseudomonadota bacterium]
MTGPLLTIENLNVAFPAEDRTVEAVKNLSLTIARGETLALVGESGSGKSVTALAMVGLLPDTARVTGSVKYAGAEMIGASRRELMRVRGNDISFIFQEPMTSLNPLHTIEKQLAESLALHQGVTGRQARGRIIELLNQVGLRDPEERLDAWPHQLSGGQRQRVMIAMAIANDPELLIADEPTTALDVTVQQDILALLAELRERHGMGMLFITHDLNLVRRHADRVCVLYNGQEQETGPVGEVFSSPRSAYTRTLLDAEPTGRPAPVTSTARLLEAGEILDIEVLDHVVIGAQRYVSMKERKLGFE